MYKLYSFSNGEFVASFRVIFNRASKVITRLLRFCFTSSVIG